MLGFVMTRLSKPSFLGLQKKFIDILGKFVIQIFFDEVFRE